jgi:flagellar basal-body rod protein FlgC
MSQPILEISRTGMDVEYRRLEVVANNIANVGATTTADGESFAPLRLVTGPKAAAIRLASRDAVSLPQTPSLFGARVFGYEAANTQMRKVHEPGHPQADINGFVSRAGVDQVTEMTTMMKALRAYEANVAVFNATRSMYLKAIEIGGRQ